ncbi:MAG TPA: ThiF family adenylyltransferase [Streptosporangiaceae bacterium]|nr:ThiF family adenylyltransferase [Streptosporangiaceae bacterium]
MDKYARQRGLVAQDILADAEIGLHGTGPALPYVLQCLALAGVGTRHGRIRLFLDDRPVTGRDIAGQFLLRPSDIGDPIGHSLARRIARMDSAIDIDVASQAPARTVRGLAIAVPTAAEWPRIQERAAVTAWGQVLRTSAFVGPAPVRLAADPPRSVLTGALAAVCGGMLAQATLRQLGAIIDGPAVLSSWFEEHLWIRYPGIGKHARAAVARAERQGADGRAFWPRLSAVLETAGSPEVAESFAIIEDGQVVYPLITTIPDGDDTVIVTTPARRSLAPAAVVRSSLAAPGEVQPVLWSPVDGPELNGDEVTGDDVPLPGRLPPASVVLCGAGALGTWAAAVIAASGLPDTSICLVDMDQAIEAHNLNRQVLFGGTDIGRPKAARAADRLRTIDPALNVRALALEIEPGLIGELTGSADVEIVDASLRRDRLGYQAQIDELARVLAAATAVLSCPDNLQVRWTLNVIAERLGIPLINGAIVGFAGRVHVCDPADASQCLVCWLGQAIANNPRRHSCTDLVGDQPVASIVTSAAIIGAAQAALLIAQRAGQRTRLRRYHILDGPTGALAGYRAAGRDPGECPAHLFDAANAMRRREEGAALSRSQRGEP